MMYHVLQAQLVHILGSVPRFRTLLLVALLEPIWPELGMVIFLSPD